MTKGAVILCGGKSSRMGRDKAMLPFGSELMLQRVVRLVAETVEPGNIVVVAGPDQFLPELRQGVQLARDDMAFRGPLMGLATGLRAIGRRVDAVYATGCDVPLLVPAFVRRMFELLGDYEIAMPFDGEYHHPLAAVYRPSVLNSAELLLRNGQGSARRLIDVASTRFIQVGQLREIDPNLDTLKNLNLEQDYVDALAMAGISTQG